MIEIPKGYEVESFNKQSGQLKFKEVKDPIDRIKTVADVLADNNITQEEFDFSCVDLPKDEKAYRLLKFLVKSLNQGWTPDWASSNENKYFPWFEMRGSSGFRFVGYVYWSSVSDVGSRFCFKTRELAEYAGKQFESVYKDFMVID
jgi:hypothetical protein